MRERRMCARARALCVQIASHLLVGKINPRLLSALLQRIYYPKTHKNNKKTLNKEDSKLLRGQTVRAERLVDHRLNKSFYLRHRHQHLRKSTALAPREESTIMLRFTRVLFIVNTKSFISHTIIKEFYYFLLDTLSPLSLSLSRALFSSVIFITSH